MRIKVRGKNDCFLFNLRDFIFIQGRFLFLLFLLLLLLLFGGGGVCCKLSNKLNFTWRSTRGILRRAREEKACMLPGSAVVAAPWTLQEGPRRAMASSSANLFMATSCALLVSHVARLWSLN